MNHLKYFYLYISVSLNIIDNQDDVNEKVISLDSDVYIFMTDYNSDGQLIEWNNSNINKVFKLLTNYRVIRILLWKEQIRERDLIEKKNVTNYITNP